VLCKDQLGNIVADSFCTSTPKPATGQVLACVNTTSYNRTDGSRGTCVQSLSCQALVVSITNEQTCNALSVSTCGTQPICMAQANGLGTQTMNKTCKDQNGNVVADSLCPQPKPITTQSCGSTAVINGVCGSAHGQTGTSAPTSGLCNAGVVGTVVGL
jgi:hypothetical protein